MLLILQLFVRAMAVEVDVSLGRVAECTASCICNDASRVTACREIDLRQMTMKLDLAEEVSVHQICMECFFRMKTAADIERVVQSLPDLVIVRVEIGDHRISLYKSMSKGIVGLKADRYYLVTAEDQKGILARHGFIHLAQRGNGLCPSGEVTAAPLGLQSAVLLYFNVINGLYMINDIAGDSVLQGSSTEPKDYSTMLYWVFICVSTVNLLFVASKSIKLARTMLKKGRCIRL